jgi:hypothetical protein
MATGKKAKVSDLIKDDRNANKGTDLGRQLVAASLETYGAGRSILVDKNMRIIAGNHAADAAIAAGIEDAIVVSTDGSKLVVVQRTDVDLDSKQGRELALADNRTAQANISLDEMVIKGLEVDFGLDLGSIGIELGKVGGPYFGSEYDEDDAGEAMETDGGGSGSGSGYTENLFPLAIALNKSQKLSWEGFKRTHKLKDDNAAFWAVFQHAIDSYK